jgi:hypothetical protein
VFLALFIIRATVGGFFFSPLLFLVFMGGFVALVARAASRQQAAPTVVAERPLDRARVEQVALAIAAEKDGLVTPAAVAMRSGHVTVKQAADVLADMAAQGLCDVDATARGGTAYRFDLGDEPERELSAEEWVARMSGEPGGGQRLDDELSNRRGG